MGRSAGGASWFSRLGSSHNYDYEDEGDGGDRKSRRRAGGASWFSRLGSSHNDGDGLGSSHKEGNRKTRRRAPRWRRRFGSVFSASAWKGRWDSIRFTLLDRVAFYLLYVLEGIVLVAVFCFYFLRFGCRI